MQEKIKKLRSNMAYNITAGVVILLLVFGIVVSVSGIVYPVTGSFLR